MPLEFNLNLPSQSRVTETAFQAGDKVGIFVSEASTPLEIAGNTLNNELLTFDGSRWNFGRQLYWNRGSYNAFGYYPYLIDISSVGDLPFQVRSDQNTPASGDRLSGYEASDFLFATAKGIQASANPVSMTFRHIMSKVTIRLIKGEDYEGELPDDATVYVHNTVTDATIDLNAGVATKQPKGTARSITAKKAAAHSYTAIVVPQRLDNRVPLIEVVMKGVAYQFDSKFQFKAGTHHLVNLVIDKNPEQVKIEIGGELEGWN